MGGEWRLRRLPPGRTEVILRHDFAVIDNDAATVERVTAGLDINSTAELAAVSRLAESSVPVERLVFSFADSLYVPCATQDAYEFIRRADLWPGRLPHVATVTLREEGDIQYLGMETLTGDGHRHSTRSIRLCSAAQRISYKQVVPPESLLGHSGVWMFTPSDSGTMVTAEHTVAIDAAKAEGPDRASSIQAIRAHVRASLGANSLATLRSIHAANAVGYAGPSAAPWGDRGHA